ncbi:hypothetical protein M0802_006060 [Mischocyttarus mexicanus]|nr:hypothetical protein M0802_006060 [Mischocyttarus mexicanus]
MTGSWLRPAFFVGLFLSFLAITLQGVQCEEELESIPPEDLCRPYIEKALKDLGTGSLEQTSAEADNVNDEEGREEEASLPISEEADESIEKPVSEELSKEVPKIDQTEEEGETDEIEEPQSEDNLSEETDKISVEETVEETEEETEEETTVQETEDDSIQVSDKEDQTDLVSKDDSEEEIKEDGSEENKEENESVESKKEDKDRSEETATEEETTQLDNEDLTDAKSSEDEGVKSEEKSEEESLRSDAPSDNENEIEEKEESSEKIEKEEEEKEKEDDESDQDDTNQEDSSLEHENPDEVTQVDTEIEELSDEANDDVKSENEKNVDAGDEDEGEEKEERESVEADADAEVEEAEAEEAEVEEAEAETEEAEAETEEAEAEVEEAEAETEETEAEAEGEGEKTEEVEAEEEDNKASKEKDETVEVSEETMEKEEEEEEKSEQDEEDEKAEEKGTSRTRREVEDKSEERLIEDKSDEDDEEGKVKSEEEPSPEEDLIQEIEVPENLRPRDHINQLLKLDEENEEKERGIQKVSDIVLRDLKKLYDNAIQPLETLYKYRDLSNRHFGDPEIFSKPLILFMGPWSGGKSSIINYLLDIEYTTIALRTGDLRECLEEHCKSPNGTDTGAEPSPAYFNILMHGEEEEVLDGTQLAADWTFSGLQKFGQGMLDRLRGLRFDNKLLEKVNIVEIPGILEIRKQVQRLFPFNDACQWFIDRADIIFLVYDPSKLDVGPETEAILDQLKGREYQTRIILNKADQVKPEELMRVQGALIWNISPLMSSAEPPIMYSASLWSIPYETGAPTRLLYAQERAFLRDLRSAIDKRVEHKIASARRFAVRVRNHAKMVDCYLTTYYNHKTFFGNKKEISDKIVENPQDYHIYEGLSTLTNISRYDLPDPDVYRDFFRLNPLYDFQLLSSTCTYFRGCPINRLDVAIAYDLPELVGKYKKSVEVVTHENEASSPSS